MPVEMYLDTEFNGHSGELISIAIAADDGSRFYAELPDRASIGSSSTPGFMQISPAGAPAPYGLCSGSGPIH